MTGMSLYSLTEQFRELERLGTDGELDDTALEAISNTLEGLQGAIQDKALNVGAYLLNLEAYSDAAIEASKALKVRAERIQRRADVMREYLRQQMLACEIKKIDGPQFTLTRKANPPAVEISPEAKIPETMLREPDPLIARVVQAVRELQPGGSDAIRLETMMVTGPELAEIIAAQLPQRAPDRKKIGDVLKAAVAAHEGLAKVATKTGKPVPEFVNPLPGCSLTYGERLDVRP